MHIYVHVYHNIWYRKSDTATPKAKSGQVPRFVLMKLPRLAAKLYTSRFHRPLHDISKAVFMSRTLAAVIA